MTPPNLPGGEPGSGAPGGAAGLAPTDRARVPDYTAGQDAALPLISPIFGDLTGLPPLIIQAYAPILDEAAAALDRAGQFLSAHLTAAEHVTA